MSTNLEIEAKALLTKAGYDKLIAHFGSENIYKQVNYYIDSDNKDIVSKKCGLRIREKDGDFEMTLKVPQSEGKLEINQQITDKLIKQFVFPDGEIKNFLHDNFSIKIESLHILGSLETKRLDLKYKTSLISIDKSSYNGIVDYEIEAEDSSMDLAKKNLLDFLKDNEIEYKKSTGTKLKRFLNTIKN